MKTKKRSGEKKPCRQEGIGEIEADLPRLKIKRNRERKRERHPLSPSPPPSLPSTPRLLLLLLRIVFIFLDFCGARERKRRGGEQRNRETDSFWRVKQANCQKSVPHYHKRRVPWPSASSPPPNPLPSIGQPSPSPFSQPPPPSLTRIIIHHHNYIPTCAVHTTPANFPRVFFFSFFLCFSFPCSTRLFANISLRVRSFVRVCA